MKNKTRLIITALCVLICVVCLSACGDNPSASNSATPTPTASQGSAGTTNGGAISDSLLPPRDASLKNAIKAGETYRYFCWATTDAEDPFSYEPSVVKENLPIKKAEVEQQYGITIEYIVNDAQEWITKAMESSQAGVPIAELLHGGGPFAMLQIFNYAGSAGRLLTKLDEYSEYADFSDPDWWRTELQQNGVFNGHQYFVVPNIIGIENVALNQVCIFNKSMFTNAGYSLDEIYEMNESGKWTWDKFYEAAVKCTDPDAGTIGVNVGDAFTLIHSLFAASGARAVTSSVENGKSVVSFTPNTAEAIEAWDFFIKLGKAGTVDYRHGSGDKEIFLSGKVGMICTYFNRVISISQSKRHPEYGILFPPKQEEADEYASCVDWFTPYAVFSQINNPAGAVQLASLYFAPLYSASDERNIASVEAEMMQYIPDEGSKYTMDNISDKTVDNAMPYSIYQTVSVSMSDGTTSSLAALICNYKEEFVEGAKTPDIFYSSLKNAVDAALSQAIAAVE